MSGTLDPALRGIRAAAAQWLVRLAGPECTSADRAAFAAWLKSSPLHVREYLRAEAVRLTVESAVREDATDIARLLNEPAAAVAELPGVAHSESSAISVHPPGATGARFGRRGLARTRWALAASVLVALGAGLAAWWYSSIEGSRYATGVGESRRVALPDGSVVELNTRSAIRVDFHAQRRDIHLLRGEAFFVVADDAHRPFQVRSGAALVRAVGTQFNVYRKPAHTVITVVEGRVAVSPRGDLEAAPRRAERAAPQAAAPRSAALELSAGHQLTVDARSATAAVAPASVDTARALAWREHRLIFDHQPLAEVIAEFNRYNRLQIAVEDADLAAVRISGVFDPDKPQGLLRFLAGNEAVQVVEQPGLRIALRRAD